MSCASSEYVAFAASFFARNIYTPGGVDRALFSSTARHRRRMRLRVTAFMATFFDTTHANCAFPVREADIDTEKKPPCRRRGERTLRISAPVRRFFFGIVTRKRRGACVLLRGGGSGLCGPPWSSFVNGNRAPWRAFASSADRFVSCARLYVI